MKTYRTISSHAIGLFLTLGVGCKPNEGCPDATDGNIFECFVGTVPDSETIGGCILNEVPNGQPCRGGIGTCLDGTCTPPRPPGQAACEAPSAPDGNWNPCAEPLASCSNPGDPGCAYDPLPDGTPCKIGLACFAGLCCMTVPVAACASDADCPAPSLCEAGRCEGGACAFKRADAGSECMADGANGACVVPPFGSVPACLPLSGM